MKFDTVVPDDIINGSEVTYAQGCPITSLYIHVPFCGGKCSYCDFYSIARPDDDAMRMWHRGILLELTRIADEADANQVVLAPLDTIYFGGGTPSYVPPRMISSLIDHARSLFSLTPSCDITLEANPESVDSPLKTRAFGIWRDAGVNRISFGVQSASNQLLLTAGRRHTAEGAAFAVTSAAEAGFRHIAVDLMTGLPGQTMTDIEDTLNFIDSLPVDHVSSYALSIAENTPFYHLWRDSPELFPDDEREREMTHTITHRLQLLGFEHYEISNFAKEGARSRHNLVYWHADPYLAAGPAAASYMAGMRRCNPAGIEEWYALMEDTAGGPFSGSTVEETISEAEACTETILLGLRLMEGVTRERFMQRHGIDFDELFGEKLTSLERRGLVFRNAGCVRLTARGLDFADIVARVLV